MSLTKYNGKTIEDRRAELLAKMDELVVKMGELSGIHAELQKEFRNLELHERIERAKLKSAVPTNAPSGILK
jgi:hypothetical protein